MMSCSEVKVICFTPYSVENKHIARNQIINFGFPLFF